MSVRACVCVCVCVCVTANQNLPLSNLLACFIFAIWICILVAFQTPPLSGCIVHLKEHRLLAFLLLLLSVVVVYSNEATWNTGKARANTHTRPQLVCAAVVCNNRRWIVWRLDMVNVKHQDMTCSKTRRYMCSPCQIIFRWCFALARAYR